jgi:sporulation protein YlmC with PRC-barrel domain
VKRLLLTTAVLSASALAAPAQDLFRGEASPDEIRASDLMGMRVYASEAAVDGADAEGPQEGWEDIGEINDVILSRDGSVEAVLVDIGGFLGMGERQAALSMDALRFVSDSATAEDAGDYFLVVNASRANLEEAPDYAATQATEGAQASATAAADASAAAAAAGTEPTDEVSPDDRDAAMTTVTTDPAADAAMTESEAEAADTAAAATGAAGACRGSRRRDRGGRRRGDRHGRRDHQRRGRRRDGGRGRDGGGRGRHHGDHRGARGRGRARRDRPRGDGRGQRSRGGRRGGVGHRGRRHRRGALGRRRRPHADHARGLHRGPAEMMTADALQGAAVFDANDQRVGEVGELLIDDAGQVTEAVVDVGGFLGIGEKAVALPMASLDVLQQEGGDDLRVYVSQTEEELEALEAYSAE